MQKTDLQRDRTYYNLEHKAPSEYKDDPLDLYRLGLLSKLFRKIYGDNKIFRNKSVLNVAAGYGREGFLILSQGPRYVVICDYSFEQARQAKGYLDRFGEKYILCCDGERLPFKDKSFDICYISEALHHFLNPRIGIIEFIRVAKQAVIIDEPVGGKIRQVLNRIFILFGIKEEYERGYLETSRITKQVLKEICLKHKTGLEFLPYFIYYFEWYKKTRNAVLRASYKNILYLLNIFFRSFGNRAIAILVINKYCRNQEIIT
jgi:ubiquinone/menaquinone biosynthesis C-methylase UbiE